MGIEPTLSAWKTEVLPLNYARTSEDREQKTVMHIEYAQHHYLSFVFCTLSSILRNGGGRIRTSEGGAVRFTV